ncbi:MAG: IclR family transcriptional regulator [Sphingobium sp.]|nr:IclR family transcriptional regulator [Sphingobium sp.]
MSLSELSRLLDAPLSSCLYLLRALETRGYIYAVGSKRLVYPTRKLYEIARDISEGETWVERLEPYLTELRDQTKETVILGKRQGDKVVYLAVLEGPQTIRYSAQPGDLKPIHSSSIGKALLANLTEKERKKILGKHPLPSFTEKTVTDADDLNRMFDTIKKQGFAETNGETVPDVSALAKSVTLQHDQFGIGIAGPSYRMAEQREQHLEALNKMCEEVSALATVR